MSKTKQFCETSSILELGNTKNEKKLRDFFQKWKVECRADSYQCVLRFFHSTCLKYRACHESDARSYEVLQLSCKIISANLKIWCSKMQPLSGNQRPDFLRALTNTSPVLRLPRNMHLCRSSSNVPLSCSVVVLVVVVGSCLPIYLSVCLSVCLSICLSICLSVYLPIYLSIFLSIYPSIYLSIYLPIYLSIYQSINLSIYLSLSILSFFYLILSYLSIHLI